MRWPAPRALARRARRVIVLAEPTRDQLVDALGARRRRRPGGAGRRAPASGPGGSRPESLARFGLAPGGYLLAVGALEPRKAPLLLARAFARARAAGAQSRAGVRRRRAVCADRLGGTGGEAAGAGERPRARRALRRRAGAGDAVAAGGLRAAGARGAGPRHAGGHQRPARVRRRARPARCCGSRPATRRRWPQALLRIGGDAGLRERRLAAALPAAVAGLTWSAAAAARPGRCLAEACGVSGSSCVTRVVGRDPQLERSALAARLPGVARRARSWPRRGDRGRQRLQRRLAGVPARRASRRAGDRAGRQHRLRRTPPTTGSARRPRRAGGADQHRRRARSRLAGAGWPRRWRPIRPPPRWPARCSICDDRALRLRRRRRAAPRRRLRAARPLRAATTARWDAARRGVRRLRRGGAVPALGACSTSAASTSATSPTWRTSTWRCACAWPAGAAATSPRWPCTPARAPRTSSPAPTTTWSQRNTLLLVAQGVPAALAAAGRLPPAVVAARGGPRAPAGALHLRASARGCGWPRGARAGAPGAARGAAGPGRGGARRPDPARPRVRRTPLSAIRRARGSATARVGLRGRSTPVWGRSIDDAWTRSPFPGSASRWRRRGCGSSRNGCRPATATHWPAPPDGDGRPVMLIPGFLAGDTSLTRMALWLRDRRLHAGPQRHPLEHRLHGADRRSSWSAASSRRSSAAGQPRAARRPEPRRQHRPRAGRAAPRPGRDAGHARLAAARPARRQAAHLAVDRHRRRAGHDRRARHVQRQLPARRLLRAHRARPSRARSRSDVRFLSFYSRSDEVVRWEACLDPAAEQVEVDTSHIGMGMAREVWTALAAELGRRRPRVGAGAVRARARAALEPGQLARGLVERDLAQAHRGRA